MKVTEEQVRALLDRGVHPAWRKADERVLEPLLKAFLSEEQQFQASSPKRKEPVYEDQKERRKTDRLAQRLGAFIAKKIQEELQYVTDLRRRHAEFIKRHARASSEMERMQHILDYAQFLGASSEQLAGDKQAFSRWFGADAVADRYVRRHSQAERRIALCLKRLGNLSALVLEKDGEATDHHVLWNRLGIEPAAKPLLAYDGDSRVNIEAFHCLSTALKAMPSSMQQGSVDDTTLQYIYRSALESRQEVWIQCEALKLLQSLSVESMQTALEKRLTHPLEGDDFFVRRRAVLLLGENLHRLPALRQIIPDIAKDPSPYVRQALAHALRNATNEDQHNWIRQLAIEDESSQVRAVAILELQQLAQQADHFLPVLKILSQVFEQEQDSFVLRVALKVVIETHLALAPEAGSKWKTDLLPSLANLHTGAKSLSVRRWAAQARELLWLQSNQEASKLAEQLKLDVKRISPGKRARLPKYMRKTDETVLGRVLSVLGQQNFGFDVSRGKWGSQIGRGHRFGFRWWRFLYEIRNPSPDKRQAFRHTVGRLFQGNLRAPSGILSELAETKVPGEPLFVSTEGGWRPYLPLVDDVISTLDQGTNRPVKFFTSEGVTELTPPPSLLGRTKAGLTLSNKFPEYARMRNWQESSQAKPSSYLHALQELGFKITFIPHQDEAGPYSEDSAVRRFFPAVGAISLPEFWQKMQDYFFSVYENSLFELAIFTGAALTYFVGKHLYVNHKMNQIRDALPLVIGGWGTRGKSGTERIKAAMLNALGYGLVSKTTGCEAMFLYADPFGKMREMFLFRPYDKATIWEQYNVMGHAVNLGADIFLWECMALTPSYVRILQRHWVRDDVSTITNTFPDHEDLQGPAGINIPEVMTNFIPKRGVLLTTEEQMHPILEQAAIELDTPISGVGWLEAGLLTPDVLQRFPYDEHPYNIALVNRLGEELGIEEDFALKEMADRVVADLGVLKTFPTAPLNSRRLQFVNGMSANERFGCLSNWVRMEFDKQDYEQEPGVWISTVVNNRADRVARSRVFASILVADISADRHFLIGSNLHGLVGYIQEAWDKFSATLTLWPDASETGSLSPEDVLNQFARRYRIALTHEQIIARLRAMLEGQALDLNVNELCGLWQDKDKLQQALLEAGLEQHAESILTHHARNREDHETYKAFAAKLQQAGDHEKLNVEFRAMLHQWFNSKIVVIEDYYSSGNQTINHISEATPPGFLNRIMGIQNIKGTGLDFVYRWQAWDACHKACTLLRSNTQGSVEQGIRALAAFQEYGLLCDQHVRETLALVKHSPHAQQENFQAELMVIQSSLDLAMREVKSQMGVVRQTGRSAKVIEMIESFLDAGDAVKRRKHADLVYKDLIAERISIERAVLELQGLNKRQKGGWLQSKLNDFQGYFSKEAKN